MVANCAGTKQLTFLLVNEMTLICLRRENTFHNRTLHMNTQFRFREYVFMRIAMNDHCYVPCICIGHSSILFSFFFLLCSSPSPWHLCFPQTVSLCCHRVLMLAHRQQDDDDDDGAAGERQQAERDRESE